jgi:uncharacterized tellurite resistance protein B-like protein
MISKLLERLRGQSDEPASVDEHLIALSAAALLLEVAWADHDISDAELDSIRQALTGQFGLSRKEADEIIAESRDQHEDSVGMHAFTRTLVEAFDEQQRFELLTHLWRLAYSDTTLDRFEEHTIRRISELLYVSHARFIEAKRLARGEAGD